MKTIAVIAQKGGQSKSTLAAHLVYRLLELKQDVLAIDLDSQASLSKEFFTPENKYITGAFRDSLSSVFFPDNEAVNSFDDAWPEKMKKPRLGIIEANHSLESTLHKALKSIMNSPDMEVLPTERFEKYLKQASSAGVDVTVIDTHGGLMGLTQLALKVATHVVIPFKLDYLSVGAVNTTLMLVNQIRKQFNPNMKIIGFLPSMVETKSVNEMKKLDELRASMKLVLPVHVANRVSISESVELVKPVWRLAKSGSERVAGKEMKTACDFVISKI